MTLRTIYYVFICLELRFLSAEPLVKLPKGYISGREDFTIKTTRFFAFEGIPYAAPPIGPLRFQAPQEPPEWENILNTTHLDVTCYQTSGNSNKESEDCLYINVFTPTLPSVDTNVSLPVMVFIYGGGFDDGSCLDYNAPDLFLDEGIILVTFNYRVGIFGFLSTQDPIIPGNNGLKDQLFALQWTQQNIGFFSGDADRITIFGQSAGSASVAYHLLNQKSKGLYQGAILQSGSCLSPWAYQRNSREIAFATASFLNSSFITHHDSQSLLEFFLTADAKDLDHAANLYKSNASTPDNLEISQGFYWSPVIEVENPDAFLTEKMYGLLETGDVVRVPVLMGITSEESLLFNPISILFKITAAAYDENPEFLVPNDMLITNDTQRLEMGLRIRDLYTSGEPLADNLGDGIRYCSDTSFTRSIIKHAELYSQFSETYFYEFSHHGPMGYFNFHYDGAENVSHGEDIYYLFCSGEECDGSEYPESDRNTRSRLVRLWTDFAKYRNPTPEPLELLQNITWPKVSMTDDEFLYLDIGENLEIKNGPKWETFTKWKEFYASLGHIDFDTY